MGSNKTDVPETTPPATPAPAVEKTEEPKEAEKTNDQSTTTE